MMSMMRSGHALSHTTGQRSLVNHNLQRRRATRSAKVIVSASKQDEGSSFVENMINGLTVAIQSSPLAEGKKRLAVLQAGDYDKKAVQSMMESYIADNPVMIFSFSTCPFCKNAKRLLDDMGATYTAIELNDMENGMAIRAELAEKTGRTSMPNIWIGGQGIGGCNDGPGIMTLEKEGKLKEMLAQAGAL
ncbi:hypothetical protein M9435_006006 [Picochlorum sp. BPE23]|nr:hypothetical protein M9435_006006 [Picochlorum sp. BPE23]